MEIKCYGYCFLSGVKNTFSFGFIEALNSKAILQTPCKNVITSAINLRLRNGLHLEIRLGHAHK